MDQFPGNETISWFSNETNPLLIEFETVQLLSRLTIEPIEGYDFIKQFSLEAELENESTFVKLEFGKSLLYR